MQNCSINLSRQVAEVRQMNRSPVLGVPLNWAPDWQQTIPEMLRGWSSGLLIVAGQSNHGKSSLAVTLGLQFMEHNDNLWVLDFTMDDDVRDRISKYVAILSGLPPDMVKMEHAMRQRLSGEALEIYDRLLDRSYGYLASLQRLLVLDGQSMHDMLHSSGEASGISVPTIDVIRRIVMLVHQSVKSVDGQILVLIDAINDVQVNEGRVTGENERLAYIGSQLMSLAQLTGARIITTAHARKITNWRRPSMDDVYGSSALKYAAKVITFVYNDYKVRRQDSALTTEVLPYSKEVERFLRLVAGDGAKITRTAPVLIWNFLKNKTAGTDGETFLMLDPFSTAVSPIPEKEWEYYLSLLYQ